MSKTPQPHNTFKSPEEKRQGPENLKRGPAKLPLSEDLWPHQAFRETLHQFFSNGSVLYPQIPDFSAYPPETFQAQMEEKGYPIANGIAEEAVQGVNQDPEGLLFYPLLLSPDMRFGGPFSNTNFGGPDFGFFNVNNSGEVVPSSGSELPAATRKVLKTELLTLAEQQIVRRTIGNGLTIHPGNVIDPGILQLANALTTPGLTPDQKVQLLNTALHPGNPLQIADLPRFERLLYDPDNILLLTLEKMRDLPNNPSLVLLGKPETGKTSVSRTIEALDQLWPDGEYFWGDKQIFIKHLSSPKRERLGTPSALISEAIAESYSKDHIIDNKIALVEASAIIDWKEELPRGLVHGLKVQEQLRNKGFNPLLYQNGMSTEAFLRTMLPNLNFSDSRSISLPTLWLEIMANHPDTFKGSIFPVMLTSEMANGVFLRLKDLEVGKKPGFSYYKDGDRRCIDLNRPGINEYFITALSRMFSSLPPEIASALKVSSAFGNEMDFLPARPFPPNNLTNKISESNKYLQQYLIFLHNREFIEISDNQGSPIPKLSSRILINPNSVEFKGLTKLIGLADDLQQCNHPYYSILSESLYSLIVAFSQLKPYLS